MFSFGLNWFIDVYSTLAVLGFIALLCGTFGFLMSVLFCHLESSSYREDSETVAKFKRINTKVPKYLVILAVIMIFAPSVKSIKMLSGCDPLNTSVCIVKGYGR